MMEFDMHTKASLLAFPNLFGLIGYPLGHSFSQRYFREKFEKLGLQGFDYALFPLSSIEVFPELLQAFPNLRGLNVTIPYKELVIPYLDALDASAAGVGAVNVIKIEHGRTIGYNSDVVGFKNALLEFLGENKERINQALVLGTGGASKAVVSVLGALGIEPVLVSRDTHKAQLAYSDITAKWLERCPLIINTTPLGMAPNMDVAPDLPYSSLSSEHFLFDLVYNPVDTKFMQLGRVQGAQVENGLGMLYGQAERAWEIWMQ